MNEEEKGILLALLHKTEELSLRLEKASIAEYVEFLRNPRRMIWSNLIAGVARGFGFAVGASVLVTIFLYVLSMLIPLNLPVVGKLIADLVRIVEGYLR